MCVKPRTKSMQTRHYLSCMDFAFGFTHIKVVSLREFYSHQSDTFLLISYSVSILREALQPNCNLMGSATFFGTGGFHSAEER